MLQSKGIPSDKIAFIHDAETEAQRNTLFAQVRNGDVRVLLGSTFKLGLGVNIQDKLIALHHIDVPWRPADMTQREGRILRQGNTNSKVQIFRCQKLIYSDNTCYLPDQMPMEGIGMYEGYTHMANLFLSRTEYADTLLNEIREILDGDPEIDGGATTLSGGDLAVRIFGHRAQKLQQTAEKIKTVYEKLL